MTDFPRDSYKPVPKVWWPLSSQSDNHMLGAQQTAHIDVMCDHMLQHCCRKTSINFCFSAKKKQTKPLACLTTAAKKVIRLDQPPRWPDLSPSQLITVMSWLQYGHNVRTNCRAKGINQKRQLDFKNCKHLHLHLHSCNLQSVPFGRKPQNSPTLIIKSTIFNEFNGNETQLIQFGFFSPPSSTHFLVSPFLPFSKQPVAS